MAMSVPRLAWVLGQRQGLPTTRARAMSARLRLCDRNGQRNGAAVARYHVHRLERQWSHSHGLAFDFHYQEMVLLGPAQDIRVLHFLPDVSGAKLAAGAADDKVYATGFIIRLAHLKIVFVAVEYHLHS